MKAISVIFAVLLFASCQNNHKERIIKEDTVRYMTVLKPDQTLVFFSKAIIVDREYRSLPKDSSSSSLEWKRDTVVSKAFVLLDTLRDTNRKPIFDTAAKRY